MTARSLSLCLVAGSAYLQGAIGFVLDQHAVHGPGAYGDAAYGLAQQRQRSQGGAEVAHERGQHAADGCYVQQRAHLVIAGFLRLGRMQLRRSWGSCLLQSPPCIAFRECQRRANTVYASLQVVLTTNFLYVRDTSCRLLQGCGQLVTTQVHSQIHVRDVRGQGALWWEGSHVKASIFYRWRGL